MKPMPTVTPRPAESIFLYPKSWGECRDVFTEYLKKGGTKISAKDRMEVTLQLSFCQAILGNIKEAENGLKYCAEYILKNGREEEKACLYHVRSRVCLNYSNYDEGLAAAIQSLHLFRQLNYPFFTVNTSTVCGIMCAKANLFNEAMEYMSKAHSLALQMGDNKAAILCTANLNDIRLSVLTVEDCILYNKELLEEINKEYGEEPSTSLAGTCLQLANLYLKSGKPDEAESYTQKTMAALRELDHIPPHHFLYTNLYSTIAGIASARGDEAALLQYAKECSERGKKGDKIVPGLDAQLILFRFYLQKKELSKAKKHLDHAASLIADTDKSSVYLELHENKRLYAQAIDDIAGELAEFKIVYGYRMKTQQEVLNHRVKYMSTVHELEMKKKEIEQHKSELNYKNQELNMTNYHLEQRNQLLVHLRQSINDLKKTRPKTEVVFKTLSKTIDQAFIREELEKTRFREKFDEMNRGFIARLHQKYPVLSPTECRVSALLRSGFNTKEIANLLSTSVRNVENHRVSIRKKMELGREENLNLVLTGIE